MKYEIMAIGILALLFAISIGAGMFIDNITDDLAGTVKEAGISAQNGDWQQAEELTVKAIEDWRGHEPWTHVLLRHSETEAMENDFYELLEHILEQEPGGTKSSVMLVTEHLNGIRDMEMIKLGSVF